MLKCTSNSLSYRSAQLKTFYFSWALPDSNHAITIDRESNNENGKRRHSKSYKWKAVDDWRLRLETGGCGPSKTLAFAEV